MHRITEENDALLRRLQEKTSCYNVYDWEQDRKKQIKMLKKICYYPPSLIKKQRLKSKRRIDPNYEVFQFYQQNMKQGSEDENEEPRQYIDQPQPGEIREVAEDEDNGEDIDQRRLVIDDPYDQSQGVGEQREALDGFSSVNNQNELFNSKNSN